MATVGRMPQTIQQRRAIPKPEPPSGPIAHPPEGARLQVGRYLGVARASEEQLRDALILVAERHEKNYELARGATTVATWTTEHLEWLEPLEKAYGKVPSEGPEMVRAALLGGTRAGVVGELADLCDIAVLVAQSEMTWSILYQGARELRDEALAEASGRARDHARRQMSWVRTEIDHLAPDALSIPLDVGGQAHMALPKRATAVASIPDSIWGPSVAAGMLLLVGLLGLAVGKPWLGPSIGPSILLFAISPAHPTARAWNTFVGHAGGLLAGFAAVLLVGAMNAPVVLQSGELTAPRVAAAVIAVPLTLILGTILRASHPPAAATTLLVALGSVSTLDQSMAVMAGVAVVTFAGELIRRVRLDRKAPAERMAPEHSIARWQLRRD